MSSWRPHRDPRDVAGFEVQYMSSSTHSHEGAHRIAVAGSNVLVVPDGRTTARNRNAVITRVLETIAEGESTTLQALVGGLVLEGLTNIEVDDIPILTSDGDKIGSLRLDITRHDDSVEISIVDLGGAP